MAGLKERLLKLGLPDLARMGHEYLATIQRIWGRNGDAQPPAMPPEESKRFLICLLAQGIHLVRELQDHLQVSRLAGHRIAQYQKQSILHHLAKRVMGGDCGRRHCHHQKHHVSR